MSKRTKSYDALIELLISECNYQSISELVPNSNQLPESLSIGQVLLKGTSPRGHISAIVSSRLKRPLFNQTHWFNRLRTIVKQLDDTTVQIVRNTAGHAHIRTACELYCKHWMDVLVIENKMSPKRVLKNVREYFGHEEYPRCTAQLLVIPQADPIPKDDHTVSIRDQWNCYFSDSVFVVNNSGNGNIQRLIQQVPEKIAKSTPTEYKSGVLPAWFLNGKYLSHFTRAIDRAYIDESDTHWSEQLIRSDPHSVHSADRVLFKIIYEQRLRSSSTTIRGGYDVVSFTAVPLDMWHELQTYRNHRRRWDFTHYGICINQRCLSRSVNPVIYGDNNMWDNLAAVNRPFFQSKGMKVNWTVECEYRHIGDLDLATIEREDAIVFVKSEDEKQLIESFSRWPVCLFEDLIDIPAIHPVL